MADTLQWMDANMPEGDSMQSSQTSTVPAAGLDPAAACPCCSGIAYGECCLPILDGRPAPTAEALVRSRYAAFAVRRLDHVAESHAPEIRQDFNRAEAERLAEECEWKSLRIHSVTGEGEDAEVEFVMEIRRAGGLIIKAGKSRFRREEGRWLFVSTQAAPRLEQVRTAPKANRNEPCPCGSGKKYKKCHGTGE
jgi:SEC-C motif domain protein